MSVAVKQRSVAHIADHAQIFDKIRDKGTAIAIWERPLLPNLWELRLDNIVDARFTSNINELPDTLNDAMDDAGHKRDSARDILHADILMLANRFTNIMQTDCAEIRLKRVTTNSCKKFHTDYVTARLITTYLGQGTQWLDGIDPTNADEPHNIQQMKAGHVGLFKGNAWSKDTPAIHRSPPIEGTGEERLMLVINPA